MARYIKSQILSIAGSDSFAGAGIQADIKTAAALGTYIATTITCITAQDSSKVHHIFELDPKLIKQQITTTLDDIKIDIIKIGMVGNRKIINIITKTLQEKARNALIILDPVIASSAKNPLLAKDAITDFKKHLIKGCYLITPNINEAELLSKIKISNLTDMKLAGEKILALGAKNALIKGAHLDYKNDTIYHLLLTADKQEKIFTNKKLIGNTHGTGCSLSTAIASFLSHGYDLITSIKKANKFVYNAIKYGEKIGKGSKSLNHFYSSKI